MINIIDTFKDFKNCLKNNLNLSIEEKMQLWEECYISKYPELEYKCKNGYEDHGYHWRKIAKDMVFNRTKNDFDKMITAHENILEIINEINEKAGRIFNIDLDINIVLYCVFQQKLLNEEIDSRGMEWENKCKLNEDKLKKLYFAALNDNDKGTKDFFGDWFQVLGLSDTGYFLGKQFMKRLKCKYNIADIAKLGFPSIEKEVIDYLKS